MCEFLVRRSDDRIIRCEPNSFAWGAMESPSVFAKQHPDREWPDRLYLVRCPDMPQAEGESFLGCYYTGNHVDREAEIPRWQFILWADG